MVLKSQVVLIQMILLILQHPQLEIQTVTECQILMKLQVHLTHSYQLRQMNLMQIPTMMDFQTE